MGYSNGTDEAGMYGWDPPNSGGNDLAVPNDLLSYYRQIRGGRWGYVCPKCKYVWAPGWGGMPGSFRKHVESISKDYNGQGCSLNEPRTGKAASGKLIPISDTFTR